MWQIWTGAKVHIGIDPWLGCKWRHNLPMTMIDKLHNEGYFVLRDIAVMGTALLQEQGWLNADFLGFDGQEIIIWHSYVALLSTSHVHISNEDDQLI